MNELTLDKTSDMALARELVEWWVETEESGVVSRSAVIDRLLDLRSISGPSQLLRWEVDHLLANTPGINVVEAGWWNATAQRLLSLIARIAADPSH